MGKQSSIKRVSTISPHSVSHSIDPKARKRIEELFEITDEIINAYNEINEKYVSQIYRKYKRLQEINNHLKVKLNHYHCAGCQCAVKSNRSEQEDESSAEEQEEEEEDDDQQTKTTPLPSSSTAASSMTTRSKKNNPFIISDIEETQNFDANDSRFNKNSSDDEADKVSLDINQNPNKRKQPDESSEESEYDDEEEEVEEDNGMARLPLALQTIIQNKAKRNKNAKLYLLEIPRYPALCEYLRDKSSTSFDHRPSEINVRPLIENHISKNLAKDAKIRMRLRDELREIHRSYLRIFMNDPHLTGSKSTTQKPKLSVKKSPM